MRHSYLVLCTAVLLAAMAGIRASFAAGVPARTYANTYATPAANWTGCYIGGNVGGALQHVDQNTPRDTTGVIFSPPVDYGSAQSSNVIGGAQVGCDYQFDGRWVIGVQNMIDFGDVRSRNNLPDPRVAVVAPFQDFYARNFYTAALRGGYLFAPQLLGYAKVGAALTRTDIAVTVVIPPAALSQFGNAYRLGWTVGGGLEYALFKGWSVFAEFNYADFGRTEQNLTAAPGTVGAPSVLSNRLYTQSGFVGFNYKFN